MLNRFQAVFECLNSERVKYVVIGGIAAITYGVPRATFDLNILIEASLENAHRLLSALEKANLGTSLLISPQGLLDQEITVFNDRVRIDVHTSTPGVVFEDAWINHEAKSFRGTVIHLVSLADLIASKRASARKIDLEDVAVLDKNPGQNESSAS